MSIPNILPNPLDTKYSTNENSEAIGEKFAAAIAAKVPDIGVRTCKIDPWAPKHPELPSDPIAAVLAAKVASIIPNIGVRSCVTNSGPQQSESPSRGVAKSFPIKSLGDMDTQPAYVQDLSKLLPPAPSEHKNPVVRFVVNKYNSISTDIELKAKQTRRKLTAAWKAGVAAAKKA